MRSSLNSEKTDNDDDTCDNMNRILKISEQIDDYYGMMDSSSIDGYYGIWNDGFFFN